MKKQNLILMGCASIFSLSVAHLAAAQMIPDAGLESNVDRCARYRCVTPGQILDCEPSTFYGKQLDVITEFDTDPNAVSKLKISIGVKGEKVATNLTEYGEGIYSDVGLMEVMMSEDPKHFINAAKILVFPTTEMIDDNTILIKSIEILKFVGKSDILLERYASDVKLPRGRNYQLIYRPDFNDVIVSYKTADALFSTNPYDVASLQFTWSYTNTDDGTQIFKSPYVDEASFTDPVPDELALRQIVIHRTIIDGKLSVTAVIKEISEPVQKNPVAF